jgi:two-component system, NarL family, response regulator LiaR
MTASPIRVLLVDDHQIVRKGLRALLETEPDIAVVGEAGSGRQAIALARELNPDVILMDLVMQETDGVEATRTILQHDRNAHVLVLTSYGSDNKVFSAIKAGALGFLLKDTRPEELIEAVRAAARGHSALDPGVARRLLREITHENAAGAGAEPLTQREEDVLRLVAKGFTNERIAQDLFISEATVRTHVGNILGKLDLSNRTQAALYALRTGLASLDEIDERP